MLAPPPPRALHEVREGCLVIQSDRLRFPHEVVRPVSVVLALDAREAVLAVHRAQDLKARGRARGAHQVIEGPAPRELPLCDPGSREDDCLARPCRALRLLQVLPLPAVYHETTHEVARRYPLRVPRGRDEVVAFGLAEELPTASIASATARCDHELLAVSGVARLAGFEQQVWFLATRARFFPPPDVCFWLPWLHETLPSRRGPHLAVLPHGAHRRDAQLLCPSPLRPLAAGVRAFLAFLFPAKSTFPEISIFPEISTRPLGGLFF